MRAVPPIHVRTLTERSPLGPLTAMMGSIFESIAYNVRGVDDIFNPAGAAALTGVLYKSTAGPRMSAIAGLGLGAFGAFGAFVSRSSAAPRFMKNVM